MGPVQRNRRVNRLVEIQNQPQNLALLVQQRQTTRVQATLREVSKVHSAAISCGCPWPLVDAVRARKL